MSEKIAVLKGPDRIRKRPGVFFGSDGAEGATSAVNLMLDTFVAKKNKEEILLLTTPNGGILY